MPELCRVAEQAVNNAASIQTTLQSITNFRLTLLMNFIRITKRQGEPKMGTHRDSRHKFYITAMRKRIPRNGKPQNRPPHVAVKHAPP